MILAILEIVMPMFTLACNLIAIIIFLITIKIPYFVEKKKKLTIILQSVMLALMTFITILNFVIKNMLTAIICIVLIVISGFLFFTTYNTIKQQK